MQQSEILPISKKYVLFDLDGTLTDPFMGITQSVQYALSYFDIKVEDLHRLSRFIGPPLKTSFQEYYNLTEEQAEKAIKKYRERFSDTGIFENEIYDGIKDMLEELIEDGKIILMATSKPEAYARRIADFFDLTQYFTQICGSEFDGSRQEKSEIIELLLKQQMIESRDQAIMVGDRKHDVIGAKKTQLDSIGVAYGYGGNEELEAAGATYIVNSVDELRELLTKKLR